MCPLMFFVFFTEPQTNTGEPVSNLFFVFLQQLRATQRCDRLCFFLTEPETNSGEPFHICHFFLMSYATTKNKQLCDGLNPLILRFRDMWPLSCAITDMVHGVPFLYPIYTLSVLPLDFLDFCSPIYTLSIPYLYFHWIFLIFCSPYLYPIYTLSILPLDFLDFLLTLSVPYLYFHCIFLLFAHPIYTLSIPYLYPIYTYLQPTYNLEVFCL